MHPRGGLQDPQVHIQCIPLQQGDAQLRFTIQYHAHSVGYYFTHGIIIVIQ